MSRGVEEILGRLEGVESTPRRVDRDARRALIAVGVTASLFVALALLSDPPVTVPDADAVPASADLFGAFERLSVPTTDTEVPATETPADPATQPTTDGYESVEAIAPGRRT